MKKAQGLPLNTVILAAMALTVLFIVLFLVYGNTNMFSKNVGGCATKGGVCASTITGGKCTEQYPIQLYVSTDCSTPNNKDTDRMCCLPSGT